MSRKIRCVWLLSLAVAAVVVQQSTFAAGLTLNFDGAANTQPPFTNPGPPPVDHSYFTGTFNLASGSQLTVGANINFDLHASAVVGSISPTGNLSFPTQTSSVNLSTPIVYNQSPASGSATLHLPGLDPPYNYPASQLTNATVTNLNAVLVDPSHAQSTTTNSVSLNGSGSIDLGTILGLFDVTLGLDANFTGNAQAGINSISYNQTAGNMLLGSGTHTGAFPADQSTQYIMNLGIPTNPGNLNASATAGVNGNLSLSTSILGINIGLGSFPLNLNQTLPLSTSIPLPGVATLADLNPTGYNPINHDDLQATMGLNAAGLNLNFPVDSSGTAILSSSFTAAASGLSISGTLTATVTFGLAGTLQAQNIGYQLQDSIAGVVVPEPGSIALLFVGLAGALPFVVRRMRKR